jgi:7-cyano-7-deazaguanine synthase
MVRNDSLRAIGGSALTDASIAVPLSKEIGDGVPVTWYCRSAMRIFLSVAVSWAEVLGAEKIYIGAVEPDEVSGYPTSSGVYRAFNEES